MRLLKMDSECICNVYADSTHSMCFILQHIHNSVFCGAEWNFSRMNWKWRDMSCLGPVSIAREPHGYRPTTTGSQDLGSIPRHCLFRTVGLRSQPSWQHTLTFIVLFMFIFLARSSRQLMETKVSLSNDVFCRGWLWSLFQISAAKR